MSKSRPAVANALRLLKLPQAVAELYKFMSENRELKGFIISSSIYPLAILGVTLIVTVLLFTVFVPRFAKIFADMGREVVGTVKLTAKADGCGTLELRMGEELNEDGVTVLMVTHGPYRPARRPWRDVRVQDGGVHEVAVPHPANAAAGMVAGGAA